MTTGNQDRELASILTDELKFTVEVDTRDMHFVIEWVGDNFNPEDVFKATQLEAWAESNGYTKE